MSRTTQKHLKKFSEQERNDPSGDGDGCLLLVIFFLISFIVMCFM